MRVWNAESLLGLSRGFMEARVLLSGAELGVFGLLAGVWRTSDEVCASLGISRRGGGILLDALTAMGLLTKEGQTYSCPEGIAQLLSPNAAGSVLPMVKHAATLWPRWSELTPIVQKGMAERPGGVFEDPAELEAFIGAMHVVGVDAARSIAEEAGASQAQNMLDVGGATGTYSEAFLARYEGMRATLFDRPEVIAMALKRLEATGLLSRISLVGGDFYTDALPGGHDLALLSAIIHQNSPEQNVGLYRKVYDALIPGGRILIRDHVMNADRTEPASGAMFAVNMLVATSGGNCYTFDEIRETLREAGFEDACLLQSGDRMNGLVEAFRRS
jgi:predicted O-methyltransferase YrrM